MTDRGNPSRIARTVGLVTGLAALAVSAVAVGFEVERRMVGKRLRKELPGAEPFFSLQAEGPEVTTADGVSLHVEVDQPTVADPGITIVMVHGYVLSLHCWHFIRQHFRGRHRIVLYDQRSHGQSGRSVAKRCRVRHLARDLKLVLDATTEPDEPVVLMGHSMGGMAIMEFAARYPELIGTKVRGVALLNTSGGELRYHSIVRGIPGALFPRLAEPLLTALNRVPRAVAKGRQMTADVAYVVTRRMGFGSQVPAAYVEFLSEMISRTPLDVVADYYPAFAEFDGGRGLQEFTRIPTLVIAGETDQIIPVEHAHRLLALLPDADSLIIPDSGHLGMIEHHEACNEALQRLVDRV